MTAPTDPLLHRLARLARDEERLDPDDAALEAYAAGTLAADQTATLEARARTDRAFARRLALHRPLAADWKRSLVTAIRAAHTSAKPLTAPLPPPPAAAPLSREDEVTRARTRRRAGRLTWAGLAACAAAALTLLTLRGPGGDVAALPLFLVEVEGLRAERGVAPARDQHVRPAWLSPQTRFSLLLRPERAVEGPVLVRGFLRPSAESQPTPIDLKPRQHPGGVVEITGRGRALFGNRRGPHVLTVVIAREGFDGRFGDLAQAPHAEGPGWQRVTVDIELLPGSSKEE